jgi:hypothetical protein
MAPADEGGRVNWFRCTEGFAAMTSAGPARVEAGQVLGESHELVQLRPRNFRPDDPSKWSESNPGPDQLEARRARMVEIRDQARMAEWRRRRDERLGRAEAEQDFWRRVDEMLVSPPEPDHGVHLAGAPGERFEVADAPDEQFWEAAERTTPGGPYSRRGIEKAAEDEQFRALTDALDGDGADRLGDEDRAIREAWGWPEADE